MRVGLILAALLVVIDGNAGQAQSASGTLAEVRGEGQVRSLDCAGGDAVVGGSRNIVNFAGPCTHLEIRGDDNVVTVALSGDALIDIEGSRNRVRLSTLQGASPHLRAVGAGTDVSPLEGSTAPAADTAELVGEGQKITLDCKGGAATMSGTRNEIDLLGRCRVLTMRGEASVVRADLAAAAQVSIEGNALALIYTVSDGGPPPDITVRGMGSAAVRAGRETALALRDPKTHAVVGTVPVLVRDLDATIVRTGTLVALPPAVFADAALTVAGEMQMDRLVALLAQTWPHGVRVIGADPGDPTSVRRAGVVRNWLVSHGVKAVSVQAAVERDVAGIAVLALR